jgi:preprotein translocase subunit Sec61beta
MNRRGQKKFSLPSSYGGIVRYFEEYKSKIMLKPGHVVFFALIIIIIVMLLNLLGRGLFGF